MGGNSAWLKTYGFELTNMVTMEIVHLETSCSSKINLNLLNTVCVGCCMGGIKIVVLYFTEKAQECLQIFKWRGHGQIHHREVKKASVTDACARASLALTRIRSSSSPSAFSWRRGWRNGTTAALMQFFIPLANWVPSYHRHKTKTSGCPSSTHTPTNTPSFFPPPSTAP